MALTQLLTLKPLVAHSFPLNLTQGEGVIMGCSHPNHTSSSHTCMYGMGKSSLQEGGNGMPPMCSATHEEPQEKRKECHPCSLKTPSTLTTPKAALHTLHEDPQPCSHASKLQQVSHTHNSYSTQGIKKETSTQGAQSKDTRVDSN